jgi:hypothetical protein
VPRDARRCTRVSAGAGPTLGRATRTWSAQLDDLGPAGDESVVEARSAWAAVAVETVRQLDEARDALQGLGARCRG